MIMEMEDLLEDTRLEAQGALRAERKAQEERHDLEEQIDAMQSRPFNCICIQIWRIRNCC